MACPRGAGASQGRTSWTAKAEIDDYVSFAGFFIHYLRYYTVTCRSVSGANEEKLSGSREVPTSDEQGSSATLLGHEGSQELKLVLGGYSYGSLVAMLLPDTSAILERFQDSSAHSIEAQIVARSWQLATPESAKAEEEPGAHLHAALNDSLRSQSPSRTEAGNAANSSRRRGKVEDHIRKSLDRVRTVVTRRSTSDEKRPNRHSSSSRQVVMPTVETYYLLISPLLQPVAALATMFTRVTSVPTDRAGADCGDDKFAERPTLAIFGDGDIFTSIKKLRRWAGLLRQKPGSSFSSHEVAGAGHFWNEERVEDELKSAVENWIAVTIMA